MGHQHYHKDSTNSNSLNNSNSSNNSDSLKVNVINKSQSLSVQ